MSSNSKARPRERYAVTQESPCGQRPSQGEAPRPPLRWGVTAAGSLQVGVPASSHARTRMLSGNHSNCTRVCLVMSDSLTPTGQLTRSPPMCLWPQSPALSLRTGPGLSSLRCDSPHVWFPFGTLLTLPPSSSDRGRQAEGSHHRDERALVSEIQRAWSEASPLVLTSMGQ